MYIYSGITSLEDTEELRAVTQSSVLLSLEEDVVEIRLTTTTHSSSACSTRAGCAPKRNQIIMHAVRCSLSFLKIKAGQNVN